MVAAAPEVAALAVISATGMAVYGASQGNSTDISDFWANCLDDAKSKVSNFNLEKYVDAVGNLTQAQQSELISGNANTQTIYQAIKDIAQSPETPTLPTVTVTATQTQQEKVVTAYLHNINADNLINNNDGSISYLSNNQIIATETKSQDGSIEITDKDGIGIKIYSDGSSEQITTQTNIPSIDIEKSVSGQETT